MIYARTAAPAALAVSLETFKAHLRREAADADDTFEDEILTAYLKAAIEHVDGREGSLGRCLVDQTWTARAARPERLATGIGFRLELGPIRAPNSVLVHYRQGADWTEVAQANFRVEPERLEEASIVAAPGFTWPTADNVPNAWRVTFTAGFGAAAAVPDALKAAILLIGADLDGDRSGKTIANLTTNPTVERLLGLYRKVSI